MTATTTTESLLIDARQAAAMLGISEPTLRGWRASGCDQPPWVKMRGRVIKYRPSAIREWIERREMETKTASASDAHRGRS
jgi:predicted DNA-binding transcriptional regulator AlpA